MHSNRRRGRKALGSKTLSETERVQRYRETGNRKLGRLDCYTTEEAKAILDYWYRYYKRSEPKLSKGDVLHRLLMLSDATLRK